MGVCDRQGDDNLKKKDDLLLYYNEEREALGIQPRDQFLNSKKAKVVVWIFVFTEDRKLLLQKRKDTAKDNRGLWDKSVGGHVERSDVESSRAAAREVAEELFTDEHFSDSAANKLHVTELIKSMKYLGDWSPDNGEIYADNNYFQFFRMNYEFSKVLIQSYRVLPNGKKALVNFFVDAFVFLAPKTFNIKSLLNSDYMLANLSDIEMAKSTGFFPHTNIKYTPTPDLEYIVNCSTIWDDLLQFSEHILC